MCLFGQRAGLGLLHTFNAGAGGVIFQNLIMKNKELKLKRVFGHP